MNTIQAEYNKHEDFINEVVESKELNNAIRLTDYKMYLVTLENAHEDVKRGKSIFCCEGDIESCVTKLKEGENAWRK